MEMPRNFDNRVMVLECPAYNPEKIRGLVNKGMSELGYAPKGKVAIKPNVVFAYDPKIYSPTAYTNFDVTEAAVRAVADKPEVDRMYIIENPAIGNPSVLTFKWSGYADRVTRLKPAVSKPLELVGIDEDKRVPIFLGGAVHSRLRLSKKFAEADTKIYIPKLKCHCVSHMTGAVKLNVGILNFDDRAIRHDFLLNEKIADLAQVGWPDFVVMDAINVGVGNEALPAPRRLGLILMGKNALAVDLVACRLLGLRGETKVPYLTALIKRGYKPGKVEDVALMGDATSVADLDRFGERVKPYDDEFYRWQDCNKEFARMGSPLKLLHGPYSEFTDEKCETGCVMGIKMYMAFLEAFAGAEAFRKAKPTIFIIGNIKDEVDAQGGPVFMFGSCAKANIKNAKYVSKNRKMLCHRRGYDFAGRQPHRDQVPVHGPQIPRPDGPGCSRWNGPQNLQRPLCTGCGRLCHATPLQEAVNQRENGKWQDLTPKFLSRN